MVAREIDSAEARELAQRIDELSREVEPLTPPTDGGERWSSWPPPPAAT